MTVGAFAVVIALKEKGEKHIDLQDYRGLGLKYPFLGILMTIFMISLSGIPPTAGFVGKFSIFSAAINNGFIGLAVIGVLNSLISVFFYLRVIVFMFMHESESAVSGPVLAWPVQAALVLTGLGTLWLGLFPNWFLSLTQSSLLVLK